ncbi:glycosyltransferase [Candidatus Nitrospira bockiana]
MSTAKEQDHEQIDLFSSEERHQSAGEAASCVSVAALSPLPSTVDTDPVLSETRRSARGTRHCLVSVVVPTYKRPHLLDRCLAALVSQIFDAEAYEVLVVDDGPDEETRRVVMRWAPRRPGLTVAYHAVTGFHGPAAARNLGWRAAQGAIIAFTDDDCIPSPEWLAAGVRAFEQRGVAGVWGRIIVPISAEPTDYEKSVAGLENAPLATANCFYRRQALADVGGFDERFTRAWREDSDLHFSVIERGYRCVPQPEAVVVHPVRPAPWGVSIRLQRNSVFNALLYKKHPRLYRQWIQEHPPWHYYTITAALTLATVMVLSGHTAAAALALIVWAGLTADFCAHRLSRTSRRLGHVLEMLVTSAVIPPVAVFWRLRGAVKYQVLFL